MEYYSIRSIDIQVKKLESGDGWHIGDDLLYLVMNGAWCSHVKLHAGCCELGVENFIAQIIYLSGDEDKLIRDYDIILQVFREKLQNPNISLLQQVN